MDDDEILILIVLHGLGETWWCWGILEELDCSLDSFDDLGES